jgi:hypothetical protein
MGLQYSAHAMHFFQLTHSHIYPFSSLHSSLLSCTPILAPHHIHPCFPSHSFVLPITLILALHHTQPCLPLSFLPLPHFMAPFCHFTSAHFTRTDTLHYESKYLRYSDKLNMYIATKGARRTVHARMGKCPWILQHARTGLHGARRTSTHTRGMHDEGGTIPAAMDTVPLDLLASASPRSDVETREWWGIHGMH